MEQTDKEADAIKLLKFQHKRICDLLFHYEQSEVGSHKLSFAETALNQLTIHSHVEEEVFYPFVREHQVDLTQMIDECFAGHKRLDEITARLAQRQEFDTQYDQDFTELSQILQEHISLEEHQLFPQLSNLNMDQIVPAMKKVREEFLRKISDRNVEFTPQTLLFKNEQDKRQSA